jgi:BirA family biotin operon repressor/biotin-[acetyl-CoA-carboxylase] ligase
MSGFPANAGSIPVVAHDIVGSTNAEALALAAKGERGPLFIAARQQSMGRGRRGREWVSKPGNLYTTLLIADPASASVSAQLCFVAALALHDAVLDGCAGLAPSRLKLKWPNDLLLDKAKIAGILIEGVGIAERKIAAAIGFGVNCRHHPSETPYPAADLAEAGFPLLPEGLLAQLGTRWEQRVREWNRGEGFTATREAWLLRASGIGEAVEIRLPQQTLSGIFESINEEGALLLRRPDGERIAVAAGDVFPLNA